MSVRIAIDWQFVVNVAAEIVAFEFVVHGLNDSDQMSSKYSCIRHDLESLCCKILVY